MPRPAGPGTHRARKGRLEEEEETMTKTMIAISMAVAMTAANIAVSEAGNLRLKSRDRTAEPPVGQLVIGGAGQHNAGQHNTVNSFKDHFNPNCVQGFQKFDQNWVGSGANKRIQSFSCRTGWIECPEFPSYVNVSLEVDTDYQGDPDLGGRVRIVYTCAGWDPAG